MKPYIITLFLCVFLCASSCKETPNSSTARQETEQDVSKEGTTPGADSTMQMTIFDSALQSNVSKIYSIEKEIKDLKETVRILHAESTAKQLDSISSEVKELRNSHTQLSKRTEKKISEINFWVAIIIISLLLIVSFIYFVYKIAKIKNDVQIQNQQLKNISVKLNELSSSVSHKPQSFTNYSNLEAKIRSLAIDVESLKKQSTINIYKPTLRPLPGPEQRPPVKIPTKPEPIKGYFDLVIGDGIGDTYFRQFQQSQTGQPVFIAEVQGNIAKFAPISIAVLKGDENPRKAIEFNGVGTEDATHMSIISHGEAKKIGNEWIIVKKAVIKLS